MVLCKVHLGHHGNDCMIPTVLNPERNAAHEINIIFMAPGSGAIGDAMTQAEPYVSLALQSIEDNSSILPGSHAKHCKARRYVQVYRVLPKWDLKHRTYQNPAVPVNFSIKCLWLQTSYLKAALSAEWRCSFEPNQYFYSLFCCLLILPHKPPRKGQNLCKWAPKTPLSNT